MGSYEGDGARDEDPFVRFRASFERARSLEGELATRAALATVSEHGQPSVRYVLVKHVDNAGFVFFTNFESRKARELRGNPRAALAFHWVSLGEQVRVEGSVTRVTDSESDAYFATRPRGSQLGAWASAQSAPIASRTALEAKLTEVAARFQSEAVIPRPPHWGGFRVAPSLIEFWQDRRDRLHDRMAYMREEASWRCARLQP